MERIDILKTLYAIEKASRGFDLSKITPDDLTETKEGSCLFKLEETLLKPLDLFYSNIQRDVKDWKTMTDEVVKDIEGTVIEVSEDIFKSTCKLLQDLKVVRYEGVPRDFIDKDFLSKLEDIRKGWDYKTPLDCPLRELSIEKTDTDFKTLLAITGYKTDLQSKVYEHYKTNKDLDLGKAFKGFKTENNRVIIPLSEADKYDMGIENDATAIVISSNPYDFYFCSYGNSFQSCFALNSSGSQYFAGYVPKSITEQVFIVYLTNGKTVDVSIIQGHKMHIPQMYGRCWAYTDTKKNLLLDKRYGDRGLANKMCKFLEDNFKSRDFVGKDWSRIKLYGGGAKIKEILENYDLPAYYDSLRVEGKEIFFRFSSGCCGHGHASSLRYIREGADSFIQQASKVAKVGTLDMDKEHVITDTGVLTVIHKCPVTNFLIDANEKTHPVAKYFPYSCKNSLYITYIDGYYYVSAISDDSFTRDSGMAFSSGDTCIYDGTLFISTVGKSRLKKVLSLKALKDFLKGYVKKSGWDIILLRTIEDDKVTFQTFKNMKGASDEDR